MATDIQLGATTVTVGTVRQLVGSVVETRNYDVTADGKKFLVMSSGKLMSTPLTLVVNWPGEIGKK